jgi:hypothetical protein
MAGACQHARDRELLAYWEGDLRQAARDDGSARGPSLGLAVRERDGDHRRRLRILFCQAAVVSLFFDCRQWYQSITDATSTLAVNPT